MNPRNRSRLLILQSPGGGGGAESLAWGSVIGDIEDQADLFTTFQPLEDQRLSTSDSPSFAGIYGQLGDLINNDEMGSWVFPAAVISADNFVTSAGNFASLFDGSGGSVAIAGIASSFGGTDADSFFGSNWGTPTFDATNLYGIATGLYSGLAGRAYSPGSDGGYFDADTFFGNGSGWGTPTFDAQNLYGSASNLTAYYAFAPSGGSANEFFNNGLGWGMPEFDASYLFGYASSLTAAYANFVSVGNSANAFFGSYWGTPAFDASNLYGFAVGLGVSSADSTSLLIGGVTNQIIQVDGVSYYPHVTAGVLTFTATP